MVSDRTADKIGFLKPRRKKGAGAVREVAAKTRPAPPSPPAASRNWKIRLALLLVPPILLAGALEAGLRVGGFGFSTDFFKPLTIDGRKFLVENDEFAFRVFPP